MIRTEYGKYRDDRQPEPTTEEPRPLTFVYDIAEGLLIAEALRDKAQTERDCAAYLREHLKGIGAEQADNRAELFQAAAERIYAPAKEALVFGEDGILYT